MEKLLLQSLYHYTGYRSAVSTGLKTISNLTGYKKVFMVKILEENLNILCITFKPSLLNVQHGHTLCNFGNFWNFSLFSFRVEHSN